MNPIEASIPYPGMSPRYDFIPTSQILTSLGREGFIPVQTIIQNTRSEDKRPFTKHMITFQHRDHLDEREINQLCYVGSHDGSSASCLDASIFRKVCANGLITGISFASFKIPHRGDHLQDILEAAHRIVNQFKDLDDHKDAMKSLPLSDDDRIHFAIQASKIKWGEEVPIKAELLLQPRRVYDVSTDLWTTFNVVQENLMKGGIPGV